MPFDRGAMLALGNFIREQREARGWTQTELAARMGSPKMKSSVSRWEAGEVGEIELSSLLAVADALEVSRWRVIELLAPLDHPSTVSEEKRHKAETLIDAFPWLDQLAPDLAALAPEDRKSLLTYLRVLQQSRESQPAHDQG